MIFSGTGQAGGSDTDEREAAGAGGDDGPTLGRERAEEFERAGQRDDAVEVFDFAALDFVIFGFDVAVREVVANGGDAGAAVGGVGDFGGVEAVFESPAGPDAGDSGGGVDEDTVEIEEDSAGEDFFHWGSLAGFFGEDVMGAGGGSVEERSGASGPEGWWWAGYVSWLKP